MRKKKIALPKRPNRVRISMDVSPKIKEQLEGLQKKLGAPNMREVFVRSLAITDLIANEIQKDRQLWTVPSEEQEEMRHSIVDSSRIEIEVVMKK